MEYPPRSRFQESWDSLYRTRKRLYGRSPPPLPVIGHGLVVLEVGCGDGKGLSGMIDRGWMIHAIDFSQEAIRLCKRNPLFRDVSFCIVEAAVLPFRDESFDVVVLSHVLGHGQEEERLTIARESVRVVKSGGYVFFRDFSDKDFRAGSGVHSASAARITDSGVLSHFFTLQEVMTTFPGVLPVSLHEETWFMGGKRGRFKRAELTGVFRKI